MANKFIINKDLSNEFIFTIKATGSTLGMTIDPADTFEFRLYELCTDTLVATITMTPDSDGSVEVYDENNGKIKLTLTQAFASTLTKDTGEKVDGCYLKPGYRAAIDCTTVNNGTFVVKLPKVYVE